MQTCLKHREILSLGVNKYYGHAVGGWVSI